MWQQNRRIYVELVITKIYSLREHILVNYQ